MAESKLVLAIRNVLHANRPYLSNLPYMEQRLVDGLTDPAVTDYLSDELVKGDAEKGSGNDERVAELEQKLADEQEQAAKLQDQVTVLETDAQKAGEQYNDALASIRTAAQKLEGVKGSSKANTDTIDSVWEEILQLVADPEAGGAEDPNTGGEETNPAPGDTEGEGSDKSTSS